jgi:hypothetical protein
VRCRDWLLGPARPHSPHRLPTCRTGRPRPRRPTRSSYGR